jgi:hypothetical protein
VRVDAAERDGRLRATGKKLVADLAAVGEDLRIGPATIELVLPQVVLDPRATLPLVETMARLARLLVGTPAVASPYRCCAGGRTSASRMESRERRRGYRGDRDPRLRSTRRALVGELAAAGEELRIGPRRSRSCARIADPCYRRGR